jgi:hypothetical protein
MPNIDTEIAAKFWPANKPEVTYLVADYAPSNKSIVSYKERIMALWNARSPHSKRMATVTQYTPFLALALPVLHQVFV